ncbi:copper amine oxidase N-terminal domain-containing protein [Paenibacillus glacialis]|uniref:Copper amine oxidase-like N-terminal domain-containing protein n=1 Tax=Paenibacillus glacialis TaxID=494026 RepID=A0A168NTT3_9BACL|nr:copper amine oxidase N-terminal domain-containing protein [Paenibacillus glacialis]OAB46105.1 hypothetical protein PGLA_01550 [Paenibacillus glacialis]
MKRMKVLLAAFLVSMLVILAGCQSVGGLDISKTLADNLTVKSSESKQTLSLEIVPSGTQMSEEEKEMLDLINSFSLTIDHAMMQDASTGSVEGSLSLDGKKLPFHVSVDKKNLILWVEGAKQPISIALDTLYSGYGVDAANLQPTTEQSQQLIKNVGKFLFKNVSNPASISVSSVTDTVYGESLSLQKLHVDIRGDELVGLAKSFLTSVSKDKEGVKELISTLYDVYYPIFKSEVDTLNELSDMGNVDEEVLPFGLGTLNSVIDDKEAAVIYLTNQLQKALNEFLVDYDKDVNEMFTDTPELNELFSKNTVLAMDYMFDKNLNVRKQNIDLTVQIPTTIEAPIKQIKVHSTSEIWNVNKAISANIIDISKGSLAIDLLNANKVTPGTMLRNFDNQSEAYRFIKEDMGVTQKYIYMNTLVDEDYDWYYGYALPIDVNKTKMVPLRYVAEQLDAELKLDASGKQITIIDDLTGSTIVLKNGSNQALVDGKVVKLTEPVMKHDGTYYVPLHFIAKALGSTVQWDNDSKSILIERK